ncbi:MAG: hypothetical protein AB7L28_14920, partial [Kofleriaceae bacterium]
YIRSVIGVIGCILAAGCIGAGAHALMGGIPALARFVLTTIAIAGAAGVFLAYTQGLSPRTLIRALKGEAAAAPAPPLEPAND